MSWPNSLRIRSTVDMVTAVPYLIGFHPADGSIVLIVCNDGRVTFAARTDLPDPDDPAQQMPDLAAYLLSVTRQQRQPITAVIFIGYGDAAQIDPALREVADVFTTAGLSVWDLLRITAGRYFSLICDNPDCCPPEGTTFDRTTSLVAVQATAAGLVALGDRVAVAARFAPVEGAAREAMSRATFAAVGRFETLTAAGDEAVHAAGTEAIREALRKHDSGETLPYDETAWLTLLLTQNGVRDEAIHLTQPHDGHVTFWAEVTRRAEEPLVPAPAVLLAITAWRCGAGGLAVMAAEHALRIDPDYQLAVLIAEAVRAGLPPAVIEEAIRGD